MTLTTCVFEQCKISATCRIVRTVVSDAVSICSSIVYGVRKENRDARERSFLLAARLTCGERQFDIPAMLKVWDFLGKRAALFRHSGGAAFGVLGAYIPVVHLFIQ